MPHKILCVFDREFSIPEKYQKTYQGADVFLCPLTFDRQIIASVEEGLKGLNPSKFTTIPYLHIFHDLAFQYKKDFIYFISDFAGTALTPKENLKQYFKCPQAEFSLWWLSLIIEKILLKVTAITTLLIY